MNSQGGLRVEAPGVPDRSFDALNRQLRASIDGIRALHREASELHVLGAWAVRAITSGWAMVKEGKLRLTNRAFDLLDRDSVIGPGWVPLPETATDVQADAPGRSLSTIVVTEARQLVADQAASWRRRFVRGDRAVELLLEAPTVSGLGGGTILALACDVTGLIRAQAQAAQLRAQLVSRERTRTVGEVAMGVAHDLGNMIGALQAQLQVLEHDLDRTAGLPEQVATMRATVRAQAALVGRLKTLGRPRLLEAPTPIHLGAQVVQPALALIESTLRLRDPRRRISVQLDDDLDRLPPVVGLPDELVNVLVNLFLNARDASPQGGLVRVAGQVDDAWVVLRVEDQGTGIPATNLPRIFEPFFSTKGGAGTGLGLTLAAEVMARVGGEIRAHNRPEGGACIELRFVPTSRRVEASGSGRTVKESAGEP